MGIHLCVMTMLLRQLFLCLLSLQVLLSNARVFTSLRSQSTQKTTHSNVDDKPQQHLPKALRSSDFNILAKQHPRTPPSPPRSSSSVAEAFGHVLEPGDLAKLVQSIMEQSSGKEKHPPKQSSTQKQETQFVKHDTPGFSKASKDDDQLRWIDAIQSDHALEALESQTLKQISDLRAQLARIRTARRSLTTTASTHAPVHPTLQTVDVTEEVFGDAANQLRDMGVTVQVFNLDGDQADMSETFASFFDGRHETDQTIDSHEGHDHTFDDSLDDDIDDGETTITMSFVPGGNGEVVMEELKSSGDLKKAFQAALQGAFKNIVPPQQNQPFPTKSSEQGAALKDLLAKFATSSKQQPSHSSNVKTQSTPPKDESSIGSFMKQLAEQRDAALKALKENGFDEKMVLEKAQKQAQIQARTLLQNLLQQQQHQTKQKSNHKPNEDSDEMKL